MILSKFLHYFLPVSCILIMRIHPILLLTEQWCICRVCSSSQVIFEVRFISSLILILLWVWFHCDSVTWTKMLSCQMTGSQVRKYQHGGVCAAVMAYLECEPDEISILFSSLFLPQSLCLMHCTGYCSFDKPQLFWDSTDLICICCFFFCWGETEAKWHYFLVFSVQFGTMM